jgi:hypothetical protein
MHSLADLKKLVDKLQAVHSAVETPETGSAEQDLQEDPLV